MKSLRSLVIACCGMVLAGCQQSVGPRLAAVAGPNDVALAGARAGDVVRVEGVDPDKTAQLVVTKKGDARVQFLFSDKPEYFRTGDGIALQEEVKPGTVRLYVYHCPDPNGGERVISSVIENRGDRPMTVKFTRYSFPKPGIYQVQAKEALADYFDSAAGPGARVVPPGGRLVLDPKMDAFRATKDVLVHGLYEFTVDQPGRVTVFQRAPEAESVK